MTCRNWLFSCSRQKPQLETFSNQMTIYILYLPPTYSYLKTLFFLLFCSPNFSSSIFIFFCFTNIICLPEFIVVCLFVGGLSVAVRRAAINTFTIVQNCCSQLSSLTQLQRVFVLSVTMARAFAKATSNHPLAVLAYSVRHCRHYMHAMDESLDLDGLLPKCKCRYVRHSINQT